MTSMKSPPRVVVDAVEGYLGGHYGLCVRKRGGADPPGAEQEGDPTSPDISPAFSPLAELPAPVYREQEAKDGKSDVVLGRCEMEEQSFTALNIASRNPHYYAPIASLRKPKNGKSLAAHTAEPPEKLPRSLAIIV